jgi:SAM-dependent methyltransferase
MVEEFSIGSMDHLLELGCGRGRGVFFLSHLAGCSAVGIDFVPFFISTATAIAKHATPILPVTFRCENMETTDFSGATVIYLYGTCLAEEEIDALVHRFEALPQATKIITVSYPLTDYSPRFRTLKQFTADFPWGKGEVFLNGLASRSRLT